MEILEFKDISGNEWDETVLKIPSSTYLHASWYIEYLSAIHGKNNNKSFIIKEGKVPIAVCPLGINKKNEFGIVYSESTFGGTPNPYPAIISMPPTQRRRMLRKVFSSIEEILEPDKVKRLEFVKHPIDLNTLENKPLTYNLTEAISEGYLCFLHNLIILDLEKNEKQLLEETSQYQRKNIKRSKKRGLIIKSYRGPSKENEMIFDRFQDAHYKSAGRLTRPLESWEIMKKLLISNKATLFVAFPEVKGLEISYLFCGEFKNYSFGWSQVNIDAYEDEYSPRHLLEWEAMMDYKKRGFHYYEIGIKFDLPQLNYIPSGKEITISQFKERYGGELYTEFVFEKIKDGKLFNLIYHDRLENFHKNYFEPYNNSFEKIKE